MPKHRCHWTGCPIEVPPHFFMCKSHWWTLPADLRRRIWRAYRPGQEIDKRPSAEYVVVAQECMEWIAERKRKMALPITPSEPLYFKSP